MSTTLTTTNPKSQPEPYLAVLAILHAALLALQAATQKARRILDPDAADEQRALRDHVLRGQVEELRRLGDSGPTRSSKSLRTDT